MAFDSKNAIQIRPKSQDSLCMFWDNGNNDFPVSIGDCKDDDSYLWSFQADNGEDYGCFYNKAAAGQRLSFRNTSTSTVTSYRAAVATIDNDAWQYWRPTKTTDGLYYINNEELDAHYLYWYQTTAILKISSTRPPPADAYIWKFTSVKETKSTPPTTTGTNAPSASDTAAADDDNTDTHSGGLSKGAKIGLGIAIPLAAVLILGVAFWFWRKRKNGNKVQHSQIPQQSENEAFSSTAMPGKLPYSQVSAVDPDHYSSTFVGSIHPSRPSSQIENHEPQYDFRPTPVANAAGGHAAPPVMPELPFVDEGEQLSRGMPRN